MSSSSIPQDCLDLVKYWKTTKYLDSKCLLVPYVNYKVAIKSMMTGSTYTYNWPSGTWDDAPVIDPPSPRPSRFTEKCTDHDWVDVGFMHPKWVCAKCDLERGKKS